MQVDILIIGGGAAGFFAAINAAMKNPTKKIIILERGREVLQKVRVSGGGRCNVTHACFEPEKLVKFYPRGEDFLLEPFQKFNPKNTVDWFESRGVKLKTEADGRMFPVSNSSQTIIDCLLENARRFGVQVLTNSRAESVDNEGVSWKIKVSGERIFEAKKLVIATGSDAAIWKLLENLDLKIIPAVSSLFTFNIKDSRISELMGLAVGNVECRIKNVELKNFNSEFANPSLGTPIPSGRVASTTPHLFCY